MTDRLVIIGTIVLALNACAPGDGEHPVPVAPSVQPSGNTLRGLPAAVPLATGLEKPAVLELQGLDLFIGDTSGVFSVRCSGGPLRTVLTGTSVADLTSVFGVGRLAFYEQTLYVGYGGYTETRIVSAPVETGTKTLIARFQGGKFLGIVNGTAYFSRRFSLIFGLPVSGGARRQVASGVWPTSVESDERALYMVDALTKNVYRLDGTNATLGRLITGNNAEGILVIDRANVYFSIGSTIMKVAKQGGPVTVLFTGTNPRVIAANDKEVFFSENADVKAVPSSGGPARTVAFGMTVTAATANNQALYVSDFKGVGASTIYRIAVGA
jgi:hypothetical protein